MASVGSQKLDPNVVALGWVSFLSDVASDMIYPLLPDFLTRVLGAGPAALGLTEGVAESTASLAKVLSGWWSDRLRRRKPLVAAGYTLAALARPLIAFATAWEQVLAIRFADRVGKGIRTSPRDAMIAGMVPVERRGRAFGLQRAMDNAGALVGPLLAAVLLRFWIGSERTVFLLALVPGIAAVLILVWRVRETAPSRPPAVPRAASGAAPLPRIFWLSILVFVVFTFANSTDAFLLLRARQAGVELWQLPLLWGVFNGAKAAAGWPGGVLADRIGRIFTIALGWGIYALAYLGFASVRSPLAVWLLFAFYALFFALTEGAERAWIADCVPEESRGRAFGIFHASIGLAALPSSLLFGLWWRAFGPRIAFEIGAALAVAALALLLWVGLGRRPS